MEVHGTLWVIDELHRNGVVKVKTLLAALKTYSADSTVRLPQRELAASIRRFSGLK